MKSKLILLAIIAISLIALQSFLQPAGDIVNNNLGLATINGGNGDYVVANASEHVWRLSSLIVPAGLALSTFVIFSEEIRKIFRAK